jgi:hypothetical protein
MPIEYYFQRLNLNDLKEPPKKFCCSKSERLRTTQATLFTNHTVDVTNKTTLASVFAPQFQENRRLSHAEDHIRHGNTLMTLALCKSLGFFKKPQNPAI